MKIYQPYHILCKCDKGIKPYYVIMTYISKKEEDIIDSFKAELKNGNISLKRDNITFNINTDKIYCYGEIDFNCREDLDIIDSFSFLSHLGGAGIPFCSKYDYKTHTCKSPTKKIQWRETWSPSELARFAHASIDKPKRVVLFKQEYHG